MKKIFIKIYFATILICLLLAGMNFVIAKELEVGYPEFGGEAITGETTLTDYINYIFYVGLGIGGILAMVMIIWGGVRLMTSGGNPAAIRDAREQITSAIIGLLLLLGSWLILNLINPELTILTPLTPLSF